MMTFRSPAPEQRQGMRSSNKAASRSTSQRSSKSEFPIKLYAMLELADNIPEFAKAVTWLPHGRAFRVLDQDTFMKDVVPVFFNQTKIRSFNRQLHMWGFHRIGRGNEKAWYNENFLRGMPESMELLVRTKIKGNTDDSSDDIRAPNFYEMSPLPKHLEQPSDVLDEMRRAILKIGSSISHLDHDLTMPPTILYRQVTDHLTVCPPSRSPCECEFDMDFNLEEKFVLPPPHSPTSNQSQSVPLRCFHLPTQADNSKSKAYTNQDSFEGTSQQVQSHTFQARSNDVCFSPVADRHSNEDFEPLPFWVDNDYCLDDDFANFIEGAIHQVEG